MAVYQFFLVHSVSICFSIQVGTTYCTGVHWKNK
jgi:hypothetical protein